MSDILWVLYADYGQNGQQIFGVYSTAEKAKAAGFDNRNQYLQIVAVNLDAEAQSYPNA